MARQMVETVDLNSAALGHGLPGAGAELIAGETRFPAWEIPEIAILGEEHL